MRIRGFEVVSSYCNEEIAMPERKTKCSAGYDIAAAKDVTALPMKVCLIPTGLKAYMPDDEYLCIHIRSSLAVKNLLSLINSQGIIDADYYNNQDNEGHILVAVYNHSDIPVEIQKGMRIAQGIFSKYLLTDDDCSINERNGGFGSTGQ